MTSDLLKAVNAAKSAASLHLALQARSFLLDLQRQGLDAPVALEIVQHAYLSAAIAMHRSTQFERGLPIEDLGAIRAAFDAVAAIPPTLVDPDTRQPVTLN